MKKILCLMAVFVLVFSLAVPVLAADTYSFNGYVMEIPDLLLEHYDTHPYVYLSYAENYEPRFYMYSNPFYLFDENKINFHVDSHKVVLSYNSSSDEWTKISESNCTVSNGSYFGKAERLYWCNFDIYNQEGNVLYYEGDLNFPPAPPLAEVIQEVVEEHLPTMVTKVVGAMKVLVPCGVGCLALLVGLKLFGKRSLTYRS